MDYPSRKFYHTSMNNATGFPYPMGFLTETRVEAAWWWLVKPCPLTREYMDNMLVGYWEVVE